MVKDNQFVPTAPKTYTVKHVENKQSGLSPAARSKVINRSGSNYVSGRITAVNPSYGPMPANSSNSFSLTITLSGDRYYKPAFEACGAKFSTCTLGSVDEAIMWVVKLNKGEVKVVDTGHNDERQTDLEEEIKEGINEKLAEFMLEDLKEGESRSYGMSFSIMG